MTGVQTCALPISIFAAIATIHISSVLLICCTPKCTACSVAHAHSLHVSTKHYGRVDNLISKLRDGYVVAQTRTYTVILPLYICGFNVLSAQPTCHCILVLRFFVEEAAERCNCSFIHFHELLYISDSSESSHEV